MINGSPKVLICIPAFNEAERLPETLTTLKRVVGSAWTIAVFDDGSRDETANVAKSMGVQVVRLPLHLGYGATIQTGYKFALRSGYDFLVQFDADGQHEPASIERILGPLIAGEADWVVGNRFHPGCSYVSPTLRRIGQALFRTICRMMTGLNVTDPTSGFKGLNRAALKFLSEDYFPLDYPDADVFIMMHTNGFRCKEVDVIMYPPKTGQSMHAGIIGPIHYVIKMFLSIFMGLLRRERRKNGR
ncbi:MAG: glycosyltransferase family 2 protein [Candidatus Riflebacteria bacterium]|nr:glycosyltransferase family 2 protein [Candidatus Riflebacteria bacterium]